LQFLAGLEAYRLAGRNADLGAGPGIAPDSGLAGFHIEDAKSAQFNAIVSGESLLHGIEDGFDSHFRFGLGDTGPRHYIVNDILLDQRNLLKRLNLMVDSGRRVVKNFSPIKHPVYKQGGFVIQNGFLSLPKEKNA
jgi:hypothetical protein